MSVSGQITPKTDAQRLDVVGLFGCDEEDSRG